VTGFSIAIDGFNLARRDGTGVATYGLALGEAIASMGVSLEGLFGVAVGQNPALREVLFYEALGRGKLGPKLPRAWRWAKSWTEMASPLHVHDVPAGNLVERQSFDERLPPFARIRSAANLFERAENHFRRTKRFLSVDMADPPSVMHWTYPIPARVPGVPNIYTLHDLVPLRLPHTTLDRKRYYHRLIAQCLERADHICTVSEASRQDILAMFGVAPDRVTNTYQWAPVPQAVLDQSIEQTAAEVEGVFGLPWRGYFLYFGAIEPKKNIGRLTEAYLSVRTNAPLVIVGARAWAAEDEVRLIAATRDRARGAASGQQIITLDYLPRRLLLKLARGAKAVLFPSLYEGFGLPVVEAMQLGTPTLVGNRSALPEIAGDAAVAVDPYSVPAIAAGLRALDGQASLRETLARRGRERAERFGFGPYRERLHAMYAQVSGGLAG
jgi:glycosyltransferase involved in cell wall biosynthesis